MSFRALILSTWAGTMESQGPTAGTQAGRQAEALLSLYPRTPPPDLQVCDCRSFSLPGLPHCPPPALGQPCTWPCLTDFGQGNQGSTC